MSLLKDCGIDVDIRSPRLEEIEILKSLTDYKEFFDSNDIWLEQSKVCVNNDGEIVCFGILKPRSLNKKQVIGNVSKRKRNGINRYFKSFFRILNTRFYFIQKIKKKTKRIF